MEHCEQSLFRRPAGCRTGGNQGNITRLDASIRAKKNRRKHLLRGLQPDQFLSDWHTRRKHSCRHGPVEMLPQVMANIEKLGFKPQDVKLLLNSHGHFDHCGGFAEFKRRTGATVVASKLDGELMTLGGKADFYWGDDLAYEPVKPDRTISDGGSVELGGVTLTAHLTPGHTKGCTSWSMRVNEAGKDYEVLFLCGLTASLYKLTNNDKYPNIVDDERNTLRKLRGMPADVLLASHGFYFDLTGKAARQKAGAPNPFIDPGELSRHVTEMEKGFEEALQEQERQR